MQNRNYKVVNGTSYFDTTPQKLIDVIEELRQNHQRVIFDYGDIETGKSWNEIYFIAGMISRTSGTLKCPLLIYRNGDSGGTLINLDNVLSIRKSSGNKEYLYNINYK